MFHLTLSSHGSTRPSAEVYVEHSLHANLRRSVGGRARGYEYVLGLKVLRTVVLLPPEAQMWNGRRSSRGLTVFLRTISQGLCGVVPIRNCLFPSRDSSASCCGIDLCHIESCFCSHV